MLKTCPIERLLVARATRKFGGHRHWGVSAPLRASRSGCTEMSEPVYRTRVKFLNRQSPRCRILKLPPSLVGQLGTAKVHSRRNSIRWLWLAPRPANDSRSAGIACIKNYVFAVC